MLIKCVPEGVNSTRPLGLAQAYSEILVFIFIGLFVVRPSWSTCLVVHVHLGLGLYAVI